MRNTVSLTGNSSFKRLYYKGCKNVSDCVVIYYAKTKNKFNRLGITTSKKVGNAVTRNRVRRLIYENYRLKEDSIKLGYDICFVARQKAAFSDYHQIERALGYLLSKSSLIL